MLYWATREGMTLRPYGAESASVFSKLPLGKVVQVEVKQPRNAKHLRLYWTLCHRIGDAIGVEAEDLSDVLKLRTGHVRVIKTRRGTETLPASISFAKMTQEDFSKFYERCVTLITTEWGIARADVLECVKDLLEPRVAA